MRGGVELFREMVREAERLIDRQLDAMEELDDKSEQMIKLSVALLAAGAALAGFAVQHISEPAGSSFFGALAIGGLLNAASIGFFVVSYVGLRHHTDMHVGPHPRWLEEKLRDEEWTLARHLGSLVRGYADYSDHNVERMRVSARRRVRGLALLASSLLAYAVSVVLIAARVI